MANQLICGACKAMKKKHTCPGCGFTPYFPLDAHERFETIVSQFGMAVVSRSLTQVPRAQLEIFFQDLYLEAEYRKRNRIGGWPRLMRDMIREKDSTITYLLWLLRGSPPPPRIPPMAVLPAFLQQQLAVQGGAFNAGLGLEQIPLQMPNQAAGLQAILDNIEQQMQHYQHPGMPWIFAPGGLPPHNPGGPGGFPPHNPGGPGGPNPGGPNPGGPPQPGVFFPHFQGGHDPEGYHQQGGFHPNFRGPNPGAFNPHVGGAYQAQQGQFPGPIPPHAQRPDGHGFGYGG